MTDLIAEFAAFYHAYHEISDERAHEQVRVLRLLEASLDNSRVIADLTPRDLEAFLLSQPHAPSTKLKHLRMIRTFVKWMRSHGHIDAERYLNLIEVKAPRGALDNDPRPYTKREIGEFWEHFEERFPYTWDANDLKRTAARGEYWVRRWQNGRSRWDRVYPYARRLQAEAIVALALFGGLRRREIFNLKLEDMHYANAWIRVVGVRKNRAAKPKVRAVPMNKALRQALANWIEFRAQVLQPAHERPWLALWGGSLDPMSFSTFAHLLTDVGDGYSFHRLRHTYATERVRAGMRPEDLQPVLGHASIAMTLRYVKKTEEDVIHAAEMTNDAFLDAVSRQHTRLTEVA